MRVEIEVSRPEVPARRIVLTAPADVSAGTALDVLGAHLGLVGAAGAVQARSLVSGGWLDRSAGRGHDGVAARRAVEPRRRSLARRCAVAPRPAGPAGGRRRPMRTAECRQPPPTYGARRAATSLPVPARNRVRKPRRFPLGAMLVPLLMGLAAGACSCADGRSPSSRSSPPSWCCGTTSRSGARTRTRSPSSAARYDDAVTPPSTRCGPRPPSGPTGCTATTRPPPRWPRCCGRPASRLWERVPGDPDFLHVRLGTAPRRAPVALRDDQAGAAPGPTGPTTRSRPGRRRTGARRPGSNGLLAVQGADGDLDRSATGSSRRSSPSTVRRTWWWPECCRSSRPASGGSGCRTSRRSVLTVPAVAGDRRRADELLAAVADLGCDGPGGSRGPAPQRTTPSRPSWWSSTTGWRPDPSLVRAVCDNWRPGCT